MVDKTINNLNIFTAKKLTFTTTSNMNIYDDILRALKDFLANFCLDLRILI